VPQGVLEKIDLEPLLGNLPLKQSDPTLSRR